MNKYNDFSKDPIWKNVIKQAIPLMIAQLVLLFYNVVDRIYIGHLPDIGGDALTGIGLVFPITTLIAAFTSWFQTGGTPLFSIARGAKEEERAENILGQVVTLLVVTSVILMILCYIFKRPILFLFGASEESYSYANQYLTIYLLGTCFSMISTGLNSFINAQGFPKIGMATVIIGAVLNLVLDPIFIYFFGLGVRGAAIATVISQFCSFAWVVMFFRGQNTLYKIRRKYLVLRGNLVKDIMALGFSGFVMQGTNCIAQVTCNKVLYIYGGDMYVGMMTVINSIREVLYVPGSTVSLGAQPVIGYNYGAKQYERVRQAIKFTAAISFTYMLIAWLSVIIFSKQMFQIFTTDADMIANSKEAVMMYFFGFFFMAFMFAGQSTFTALKHGSYAVFFSIFRKIIIVLPLTIILPMCGMGVNGVFIAEPISNAIGGLASFITMYFKVYRKLPKENYSFLASK